MNQYLELLNLLGPLVKGAIDAYTKMRDLAKENGVSDADLDAADARFLKHYDDPLAGNTPPPPPPPKDGAPYETPLDSYPTIPPFAAGDHVYRLINPGVVGKYWVESKDYGITGGNKTYLTDL